MTPHLALGSAIVLAAEPARDETEDSIPALRRRYLEWRARPTTS